MKPLAMVLLVACALLALAGAVLLVNHGSAAAAETARPRATVPAGTGHAGPELPPDGTAEVDRSTTTGPDLADAPDARRAVASSTEDDSSRRDVLVSSALTGEPLADARVYVPVDLGDDDAAKEESYELLRSDLAAYLARFTTVSLTDGKGHTTIPADRDVSVIGMAPDLAGRAYSRKGAEGTLRLALYSDKEVRVRVLDQADEPVEGAPVSLLVVRQNGAWTTALATRESDAAGEVRLRHIGIDAGLGLPTDPSSRFVVGLQVPLLEPIQVDLPAELDPLRIPDADAGEDAAAGEPPWITLHAPPAGSVVVHVVDEDGAPVEKPGSVYLVALDEAAAKRARKADESSGQVLGGMQYWSGPRVSTKDGEARFPYVPVGLTLGVATLYGGSNERSSLVVAGPRTPGEEKEATIAPGNKGTRLVALLQDAEGTPLSSRDVRCEMWGEHGGTTTYRHTDEQGRMRLNVSPDFIEGSITALNLQVEPVEDGDEEAGGARGRVSRLLEGSALPELEPGEIDLGVLTLTAPPLLVAGRVVDGAGKPVAGASVEHGWLFRPSNDDREPPRYFSSGNTREKTDADGRFRLDSADARPRFGGLNLDEQAVQVSGGTVAPLEPVPFQPGEEDLLVTVVRGGWIEGTARVSDLRILGGVAIEVRRPGSTEPLESRARWSDSSFRIEGIPEGTWDVAFIARGDTEPVALVAGVRVPLGGAADDQRLQPVDLRALQRFRITVRSGEGDVPGSLELTRRNVGATEWKPVSGHYNPPGPSASYDLVTAFPGFDLRIEAQGFLTTELPRVDGDRDVLLSRGIPVVVEIVGAPLSRIDGGATLQLLLLKDSESWSSESVEVTDGMHEATLHATDPGTYRIRPALMMRTDHGSTSWGLGDDTTVPVEVPEDGRPVHARLELDPEKVRARYEAMAAVQARRGH